MTSSNPGDPTPLTGKRLLLHIEGAPFGALLARALREAGANVASLASEAEPDARDGFDAVVAADIPAASLVPRKLSDFDATQWQAQAAASILRVSRILNLAQSLFAQRAGGVVLIGPALGLTGANGFSLLTAVVEAQRALLKAAARQFGARGIVLNWLATGNAHWLAREHLANLPIVPELGPPPLPLGHAPDFSQLVPAIAFAAGLDAGRAATGATINLDGGEWMLP